MNTRETPFHESLLLLFSLFFTWPSEDEEGEEDESDDHDAHGDDGVGEALGSEPHEEKHRESEGESRDGLKHQVVGGWGLEARVNLAEQYHAVGCGTGEHAEHGEESLVDIVWIELLAAAQYIPEGDDGTQRTDEDERQPEATKVVEVDGCSAGDNHEVEAGAGDAVEGVVVDILTLHEVALTQAADNPFDEDAEQRTPQEVEAPHQRLEGLDTKVAKVELLYAEHQQENHGIDKQDEAELNSELVDGFRMRNLALRLVIRQSITFHISLTADVKLTSTAEDIHKNYAHKAAHDEACGSDAETEV